jgi:hypothetical protein
MIDPSFYIHFVDLSQDANQAKVYKPLAIQDLVRLFHQILNQRDSRVHVGASRLTAVLAFGVFILVLTITDNIDGFWVDVSA